MVTSSWSSASVVHNLATGAAVVGATVVGMVVVVGWVVVVVVVVGGGTCVCESDIMP
jgi:hypothetical protein